MRASVQVRTGPGTAAGTASLPLRQDKLLSGYSCIRGRGRTPIQDLRLLALKFNLRQIALKPLMNYDFETSIFHYLINLNFLLKLKLI